MKDSLALWEEHDAKKEAWLATLPVCSECGQAIQDERLIEVNDEVFHVACFEKDHLKWTDDYTN